MTKNEVLVNRRMKIIAWLAGLLGLITSQCMDCAKFLGFKKGHGVRGISHGLCKKCSIVRYQQ